MSADWKDIARKAGFRVSNDDSIVVEMDAGAKQTLQVDARRSEHALRVWTVIATGSVVSEAAGESALRYAWERNRFSDLLGFGIDSRGRLIGETWIPYVGLSAEEFWLHVSELARVSNWHEFRLTGADQY